MKTMILSIPIKLSILSIIKLIIIIFLIVLNIYLVYFSINRPFKEDKNYILSGINIPPTLNQKCIYFSISRFFFLCCRSKFK
jgi:hypothetical protein